jgi:hypothetical protein
MAITVGDIGRGARGTRHWRRREAGGLERHFPRGTGVFGEIDLAHVSASKEADDTILAESCLVIRNEPVGNRSKIEVRRRILFPALL